MSCSNFVALLEKSARDHAVRPAFIQGDHEVSYSEFWSLVKDNALWFEKCGIGGDCRLLLRLGNNVKDIAQGLGCMLAGACLIPMPAESTEYERNDYVQTCQATHMLDPQAREPRKISLNPERSRHGEIAHDALIIRPTSGTTGRRKGVILTVQSVLGRIEAVNSVLCISSADTVLWTLPVSFHLVVSILLYLLSGATVVLAENSYPDTLLSLARRHDITILYGTPRQFRMLAAGESANPFRHLRWALSTGTFLMDGVASAFHKRFGHHLRQAYGLIEVGLAAINSDTPPAPAESVGRPVPGHLIRVCDENGRRMEDGMTGEVQVKGPGMFAGYVNGEDRDCLRDGWFPTGDTGYLKDGILFLKGRSTSAFHVAGMKVFPEEIEACLLAHDEVENVHVYSERDHRMGDVIIADVVLVSGGDVRESQLYRYCSDHLSPWKVPAIFNLVDNVQTTSSGKVKRK